MKSTVSTVVSVVRLGTELPAPEFAELIGKPYATLKSLESGRLELSEKTALAISKATGVSLEWLLRGDPKTSPVTDKGMPWTRESFDHVQALKLKEAMRERHRKLGKSKTPEEAKGGTARHYRQRLRYDNQLDAGDRGRGPIHSGDGSTLSSTQGSREQVRR
jgi:transcriptional regulator with XRE-family HTH domain